MISKNIFRAYDIRGVVGKDIDGEGAKLIGKGFGTFLARNLKLKNPTVVVGRDGRTHSEMLQAAFIKGLMSTGARITNIGLAASPLLYFANSFGNFDAGCNITASHNPAQYNGFKTIGKMGHAIYGEDLQTIYQIIQKGDFEKNDGFYEEKNHFFEAYLEKIKSMFTHSRPLKVAIDTANGVAGAFYPQVLQALGHDVVELFTELDGTFPNHEPDPIVEKNLIDLKKKVLENKADIGLAFDGDGDRVGIVTEAGEFITADRLLMLLTQDVLLRHPGGNLVYTVSNSQALFDLAKQWGGNPVMCKVGHSFVENAMHEHHAILGGEQSGHFFLPENYYSFDDALVTACRVLKILSDGGKKTSELFQGFPITFSEPEMRPFCPDDKKFEILEKIVTHFKGEYPSVTLDGIRMELGDGAWAGIRVSNTSPCLSIIVEAGSQPKLEEVKTLILNHLAKYPEIEWKK